LKRDDRAVDRKARSPLAAPGRALRHEQLEEWIGRRPRGFGLGYAPRGSIEILRKIILARAPELQFEASLRFEVG
jgi:hypothetical protein